MRAALTASLSVGFVAADSEQQHVEAPNRLSGGELFDAWRPQRRHAGLLERLADPLDELGVPAHDRNRCGSVGGGARGGHR